MKQYLDLVQHVLDHGTRKPNRTGVDTISTFNYNYEHDLSNGFPLLTTKSVSWKNIVVEMLWFLSGQTDIAILKRHGCKFWDAWADDKGQVPSAYGNFWRRFPVHEMSNLGAPIPPPGVEVFDKGGCGYNDQIAWAIDELKRKPHEPTRRRLGVGAWQRADVEAPAVPLPVHLQRPERVGYAGLGGPREPRQPEL